MNRFLANLIIVSLLSTPAVASIIQLTSRVDTEGVARGDHTTVNVSIVNTGDEPAYNVMVTLLLPDGFRSQPIIPDVLNPHEPFDGKFEVEIDGNTPAGIHPLVLLTNYADANSYPFSTVSARFLVYKQATPIKVVGTLTPVELSGGGDKEMTLRIRNMDDAGHTVKARLYLPQELKSDETEKSIEVPARGEAETRFRVSSFGALGGSSYAVFAAITYVDDGLVHSSIAGNVIRVLGGAPQQARKETTTERKKEGENSITLYALSASLLLLIALALAYGRKKKWRPPL